MPEGKSKQCVTIALLLSVFLRCRVTEIFSPIKPFFYGLVLYLCLHVCSGGGSPVTCYIGHAQTWPTAQRELQALRSTTEQILR